MGLPDEFIMLAGDMEYYVHRVDKNGYRIRKALHSDEYAELINEYPYWDVVEIERKVSSGIWKIIQNLTANELDISSACLEDVI